MQSLHLCPRHIVILIGLQPHPLSKTPCNSFHISLETAESFLVCSLMAWELVSSVPEASRHSSVCNRLSSHTSKAVHFKAKIFLRLGYLINPSHIRHQQARTVRFLGKQNKTLTTLHNTTQFDSSISAFLNESDFFIEKRAFLDIELCHFIYSILSKLQCCIFVIIRGHIRPLL